MFDVTFEAPNYYTTSDGGLSWESHVLPNPNIAFQDAFEVSRISNNPATGTFQITGAAGVSANIVYNSTDNGNTFTGCSHIMKQAKRNPSSLGTILYSKLNDNLLESLAF